MAEGIELLLRHAFRTLRLHRVEATCSPGTVPRGPSSGGRASGRRASHRGTSRSPGAGVITSAGRSPSRTSALGDVARPGWSAPGVERRARDPGRAAR
jgi:hypothetical protein